MCSINLRSYSKIIKLTTKTYIDRINNFNLPLFVPCIHLSNKECHRRYLYIVTHNCNYNPALKVSQIKALRYSTAVEIPPPPPIPDNEFRPADVFGNLGGSQYEKVELDEEELKEEEREQNLHRKVPRKLKPSLGQYAKMIKTYVEKGDLDNAELVFKLCLDNRDKPSDYMYSLLIYAFSLQGDIKKCYKYYSDMKTRHYKVKKNVYTSLFNACANCPDTTKALGYLERVRTYMTKQEEKLNYAHYNVLIKAYGRHSDFKKAESLVQLMIDKKLKIGISTLNSLMYAANTNKESGLRHIFSIWQFMRQQQIPPNIFTYHLLLRSIRDTKFGGYTIKDLLVYKDDKASFLIDDNRPNLLQNPPVISSLPYFNAKKISSDVSIDVPVLKSIIDAQLESKVSEDSKSLQEVSNQVLPESIADIDLDAIMKQNKLILFGGFEDVLKKMKQDKITPDNKTITYLIDLIPGSLMAEEAIIKCAASNKIKLDISFYNTLIKKRCARGARKDAKKVLDYIVKDDLKPNIMTYGVLALACEKIVDCYDLLLSMESTNISINKYIAKPMLVNAMSKLNFKFILLIMEKLKKERVIVDDDFFDFFDEFQQKMTHLIKTKKYVSTTDKFKTGFSKFNMRYKSWQEDMGRKVMVERK